MKALAFSVCSLFLMAGLAKGQSPTPPDPALYGPYPTNYKMIVMGWLTNKMFHPETARIEWLGDPQPVDLGKNGQHLYGYVVNFRVNAQNQFGGYTGWQKHGALIRNGEVVKGLGGLGYQ